MRELSDAGARLSDLKALGFTPWQLHKDLSALYSYRAFSDAGFTRKQLLDVPFTIDELLSTVTADNQKAQRVGGKGGQQQQQQQQQSKTTTANPCQSFEFVKQELLLYPFSAAELLQKGAFRLPELCAATTRDLSFVPQHEVKTLLLRKKAALQQQQQQQQQQQVWLFL